jgi:hypothetical protein
MSFNENNPPAFPTSEWSNEGEYVMESHGMGLRDYFAARVLQALVTKGDTCSAAKNAYQYADSMMMARLVKSKPNAEQE